MISYISLVVFGLLLATISMVVQSTPVFPFRGLGQRHSNNKKTHSGSVDSAKPSSVSSSNTIAGAPAKNDAKKKRNIDDYDLADDYIDDEKPSSSLPMNNVNKIEHVLHPKMKETPVQIHNNADKSVDTDDSKIFTDVKMSPNELTNIVRRRRNVNFKDRSNQRRKRALSRYDLYNTDPFYEALIERQQYDRPTRAFAPIYWYPSLYERNIRSSLYEPPAWDRIYGDTVENNDISEEQVPYFINENEYEYNRFPVLTASSNIPYENLKSQQEYNIDDLPIDEDDDDDDDDDQEKQIYFTPYGPIESY